MAEEEVKIEETTTTPETSGATENPVTENEDGKPTPLKKKKSKKRAVPEGQIHVLATFNNTIITVTDTKGNVLTSASAGGSGFRGSKKGTAYAAQVAADKAINDARQNYGLTKVNVQVKGIGMGREAAIRTLASQKIQVESVRDITGIAHGGVRPRKAKRN